jgi:hypothetical protein
MAFCLALRRAGGKLSYDPSLMIHHHPAPPDYDHRRASPENVADAVHNETLTVFEHLGPVRRGVFVLWGFLVGTRGSPGVAQVPRLIPRYRNWPILFAAAIRGRGLGLRTAMRDPAQETPGAIEARHEAARKVSPSGS